MRANLDDPFIFSRRIDHRPAFHDRHRERFLYINILSRLAGRDHLDRVPVVGRGDHDRVDVLSIEDRAKVVDPRHIAVELGHLGDSLAQTGKPRIQAIVSTIEIRLVDVAQRDDLGIDVRQESFQELASAVSHADEAEPHLVAGCQSPGPAAGCSADREP